jgi:hypothetical protein
MMEWLIGKKKRKEELPIYSELKSLPTRRLPPELADKEASEFFASQSEACQHELLEPTRRPPKDEPLFTELISEKEGAVVTINPPDNDGGCLPVFSNPLRARDYVQTLLPAGSTVQYLCSSPLELIEMLRDLEAAGVEAFTLDRCPRCEIVTVIGSDAAKTADDLLTLWAIFKSTELTRADLYFAFALDSARAGQLEVARSVALETIGHVSLEDPRPHLLLGQLGLALKDRRLVDEAKAFLRFLKFEELERKLDDVARSGALDFEFHV